MVDVNAFEFLFQEVPDFSAQFVSMNLLESKPLKGLRIGLIRETLDDGVDTGVTSAVRTAALHLEELGCCVTEVYLLLLFCFVCGTAQLLCFFLKMSFVPLLVSWFNILETLNCRSHYHLSHLGCQPITFLLHPSHLRTYHVMMVSGNSSNILIFISARFSFVYFNGRRESK